MSKQRTTSEGRVRKAWRVTTTWADPGVFDIVYAETASKARYDFLLDLRDSYDEATFREIIVHRARDSDVLLPLPHRLVSELSDQEKNIILHAYGASNKRNPGYRDHYCTAPSDARLHRLAWELGIFNGPFGQEDGYGEVRGWIGVFYYLSDLGKTVARSMMPTYGQV